MRTNESVHPDLEWSRVKSVPAPLFVVLLLVGLVGCETEAPKTALVVAQMPRDSVFGDVVYDFAAEVTALSSGSLTLEAVQFDDTNWMSANLFDQVDTGELAMAAGPPSLSLINGNPVSFGSLLITGMPFGFGPEEFLAWYFEGGGESLAQDIYDRRSAHGNVLVMPLAVTFSEPPGYFVNPVPDDPAAFDASGITYRINVFGAKAMQLAFPGLTIVNTPSGAAPADELCTGTIHGLELGTLSYHGDVFFDRFSHENGDNVVECGLTHLYLSSWQQLMLSNWLLIGREFFDSLDLHEQQAIRSAAMANITRSLARDLAKGSGIVQRVAEAGGTIHASLPPQILDRLRPAVEEVLRQESEADPDFALIIDSMRSFARQNQGTLLYDSIPANERFNRFPGWQAEFSTVNE